MSWLLMKRSDSKRPTLDGVDLSSAAKVREVHREWGYALRRGRTKRSNGDSGNTGTAPDVSQPPTLLGFGKLDEASQILHQLECGGEISITQNKFMGVCFDCGFLFV